MNALTYKQFAESCRDALMRFWGETLKIGHAPRGAVLALPLMYPDGLQVVVYAELISDGRLLLSDRGATLGQLASEGLKLEGDATSRRLSERLAVFELDRKGYELTKCVRLPVDGVDIQIFGEALVSISHLLYRHEPEPAFENIADRAVQRFFREHLLEPKRNVLLEGALESSVRIDYFLAGKRPLALEVINRKGDLLSYMEQWGWRWTNISRKQRDLIPAMVYDPHGQRWDEASLRVGRSVCEVFCPYFDNEALESALKKVG
jgi:hypothetical protein